MDEKTRRQMEQQAIARQDRERAERRQKEEMERRRRDEDHNRFRMQQMALEKQNEGKKKEELEIAKRNDAFLDELEAKKNADEREAFLNQQQGGNNNSNF